MSATGFCPVTNFRTTLSSSVTSTQTNIPLSSITTTDGHVLTMADMGAEFYIVIAPGGADMEIVKCTAITNTPPTATASARGLAFYGISEANVPGNNVAHNAGTVVILTNTHYVYKRFVDKEATESIDGVKTFIQLPTIPPLPLVDTDAASKKYVDDTATAGAPAATTGTAGIVKIATDAQLQAGTATDGTYSYVPNGGSFRQTATANKVPVSNVSNKIDNDYINGGVANGFATLDGSTLVIQNPANATATPAASKIPISKASAILDKGWLGLTTTGDMVYYDGTDLTRIAIGTNFQVVTSNGTIPAFATPTIKVAAASNNLVTSSDGQANINNAAMILVKRIVTSIGGEFRISVDAEGNPGGGHVRIYRNGVAYGPDNVMPGPGFVTYTNDLRFEEGDYIELYIGGNFADTVSAKNFRIYFDQSQTNTLQTVLIG